LLTTRSPAWVQPATASPLIGASLHVRVTGTPASFSPPVVPLVVLSGELPPAPPVLLLLLAPPALLLLAPPALLLLAPPLPALLLLLAPPLPALLLAVLPLPPLPLLVAAGFPPMPASFLLGSMRLQTPFPGTQLAVSPPHR
jgi:hypothetical protein